MKNILVFFLAIWGLFAPCFTQAQVVVAGKITGNILDDKLKPVDWATVSLLKAQDSAVVKVELCSQKGDFTMDVPRMGKYILSVKIFGDQPYFSDVLTIDEQHQLIALPTIVMEFQTRALKEVSIAYKKALVERKIDRTVINVDAMISNSGSSALDVLEKSPGVQVDQNGVISLRGKQGVMVFIDDKPNYLSGEELSNYLKSLPSSSLDQIELMVNPPAKYDAAGNAGVINIKTKKTKTKGFNGGLNLNFGQGRYTRTNSNFNFNYRNDKFNFFGDLSLTTQHNFTDLSLFRRYKNVDGSTNSYFLQNSFSSKTSQSYNSRIGVDFYQSEKTTWGVVLNGLVRPSETLTMSDSRFLNSASSLDSINKADNHENNQFRNGSVNLNYRHEFNKDEDLTADIDYLTYHTNGNQFFANTGYSFDDTQISQDYITGQIPSVINIYSSKLDYSYLWKNAVKMSVGAKSSYTETDNIANYFSKVGDVTVPDYNSTNHFIYKENINAVYVNFNKDFKRLSVQGGLRMENTNSNGHQLGNVVKPDSSFKRNYTSLFPTLYFLYKLDSASVNQIGLNYGRRIDRPYYEDLNPFLTPIDKFTYYVGNPFLNPSFSQKVELSYTYDNKITAAVSLESSRDDQSETIQIINNVYYSRPGNIGATNVKSFYVDGGFDPAKWLTVHLYAELTNIHSRTSFYTGLLDSRGTYVLVQGLLQFNLSGGWNAQFDGSFQSKRTSAQFVTGNRGRINFGMSKKISASTSLRLTVNDLLYTYKNSGVINNLALTDASFRSRGDSRWANLSFTYKFGQAVANQRKHDANSAESEQNRVKSQ